MSSCTVILLEEETLSKAAITLLAESLHPNDSLGNEYLA